MICNDTKMKYKTSKTGQVMTSLMNLTEYQNTNNIAICVIVRPFLSLKA